MVAGWLVRYQFKIFFGYSAERANPIFGDVSKGCTGSDTTIGVTYFGVVNPLTHCAYILFHNCSDFF